MPRSKNWKKSQVKKVVALKGKYKQTDIDLTEDPGLVNHRTGDLNLSDNLLENLSVNLSESLSGNLLETDAEILLENSAGKHTEKKEIHSARVSSLENDIHPISRTLQELDNISISDDVFNSFMVKYGTFDQFDMRFSDETRGHQCVGNALSFIISLHVNNYNENSLDLDSILIYGDKIYQKIKSNFLFMELLIAVSNINPQFPAKTRHH